MSVSRPAPARFFARFPQILLTNRLYLCYDIQVFRGDLRFPDGEMSERLKEPVLKTGDAKASVGSNPTLSATVSHADPGRT